MKIVKASALLERPFSRAMGDMMLQEIEFAARLSHRSEDQSGLDTEKFLRAVVLGHGDWSVVEHCSASVLFTVDRGISHELVRHRLFSFTQESTRFVNYAKKMPASFIYPLPGVECPWCLQMPGYEESPEAVAVEQQVPFVWVHNVKVSDAPDTGPVYSMEPCLYNPNWMTAISNDETFYRELLDPGSTPIATGGREIHTVQGSVSEAYRELAPKWRPQEARSVLPNALACKLLMTGNLRSWRWFFLMRTTKEAHPQMREVTIPLLKQFQEFVPILFEDIEPEARQIDNAQKAH